MAQRSSSSSLMKMMVMLVVVLASVISLVESQAVLRAINGASKSLEWTSSTSGDLTFSHNGKNYLTFLTANQNNADLPQGAIIGDAESEVTGSLRVRTAPDGTSDIEGYVRGRWLSLSNDDPKNLFANGFEITRVASEYLASSIAVLADRNADVVAAQILPVVSATGVVDGTQGFAVISEFQRGGAAAFNAKSKTYVYRCDLLDCSKMVGALSTALVGSHSSINVAPKTGLYYILGVAAAANTLQLKTLALTSATASLVPSAAITLNIPKPANAAAATVPLLTNLGNYRHPVSAIISTAAGDSSRLHAVYHVTQPMPYFGDSTSLMPCGGVKTITTPLAPTFTLATDLESTVITAPFSLGPYVNLATFVIGKNGYVRITGTSDPTTLYFSGTVGANRAELRTDMVAFWVPSAAQAISAGTYRYGSVDANTFAVSFTDLKYADGSTAASGQIVFERSGVVRIETTSATTPPAGTILQGFPSNAAYMRYAAGGDAPLGAAGTVQTANCFVGVPSSYEYLTCPLTTTSVDTCERTWFAPLVVPISRNSPNTITTASPIVLHSLDVDPANTGRFVFSAIHCTLDTTTNQCNTNRARQLTAWTFTGTAGSRYTITPTPTVIDLGSGDNIDSDGAVDFDAEFSSTGTWMAVVGLHGSNLEQFNWSYRVLSFAALPTTPFTFTTARILATSIDLDSNGESIPFGAARITRKGTVNYATLLIGNVNYAAATGTTARRSLVTAGSPIIFRSSDDTFKSVYASFPNHYHGINAGGVVVWPHIATDDVSVLSFPSWRGSRDSQVTTLPMLTRFTNGFLSPNAQECNVANAGKFFNTSSRVYACVESITQDAIWTRSGIYTWAPVGVFDLRRQFSRPNNRAPCA